MFADKLVTKKDELSNETMEGSFTQHSYATPMSYLQFNYVDFHDESLYIATRH